MIFLYKKIFQNHNKKIKRRDQNWKIEVVASY